MRRKITRYSGLLATLLLLAGCINEALEAPFNYYRKGEYKEAAKEGDVEAMYEMGIAYCCGSAPFYSNRIGTRWLCRAARAGHTQAMADMGYWWRKEKGMFGPGLFDQLSYIPDNAVAYAWYALAAHYGHEESKTTMYEVEENLSPKDMERAKTYIAHYPDIPCEIN